MSETCIFCRLAGEQTRPFFVTESERLMAFPALHPINAGQLVVAPREHLERICDLPTAVGGEMLETAGRLGTVLVEELRCDGFSLLLHESAPGQPLPHLHLNVIPRATGDLLDLPKAQEANREALAGLALRLRERLEAVAGDIT
ncbi:MAG: HIT family protein [Actinomycetota bacterium]